MIELSVPDFGRAAPLFDPICFMRPGIFSVLEGTQAGRVFVDRAADPRAVVMVSDFCYFSGSPECLDLPAEVVGLLESEVMPVKEHVMMYPFTPAWQAALEAALRPYEPHLYERTTFDFDPGRYRELHAGWQARVPPGFSVRPVNAQTALEVGGIPELWGTVENFLAHGFGFCVVDEAQPDERSGFAASAQTVFVGDRHAETGVGTREAYRRRGFATLVSCAFIDHCLERGIHPDWGCVYNEASEKLAYKMGYGAKHAWPFLYIHVKKGEET